MPTLIEILAYTVIAFLCALPFGGLIYILGGVYNRIRLWLRDLKI